LETSARKIAKDAHCFKLRHAPFQLAAGRDFWPVRSRKSLASLELLLLIAERLGAHQRGCEEEEEACFKSSPRARCENSK
jgi:hypothetical protein